MKNILPQSSGDFDPEGHLGARKTSGSIRDFDPEEFQEPSYFYPDKNYIKELYQEISRNDPESPILELKKYYGLKIVNSFFRYSEI